MEHLPRAVLIQRNIIFPSVNHDAQFEISARMGKMRNARADDENKYITPEARPEEISAITGPGKFAGGRCGRGRPGGVYGRPFMLT